MRFFRVYNYNWLKRLNMRLKIMYINIIMPDAELDKLLLEGGDMAGGRRRRSRKSKKSRKSKSARHQDGGRRRRSRKSKKSRKSKRSARHVQDGGRKRRRTSKSKRSHRSRRSRVSRKHSRHH